MTALPPRRRPWSERGDRFMGDDQAGMDSLEHFHAPVAAWFRAAFGEPSRAQAMGWPAIARGEHTLLLAPTGSGKTLAAFLVAIDRLMFAPLPEPPRRCRLLYISPLKALAVDIEKNLNAPLAGIAQAAARLGMPFHRPEVAMRTGDTPANLRARFARKPADILITTPESLYLLLTSQAREALRSIECVIVDEIHALVGSKRGVHLALSLERLEELCGRSPQRIGLSATQRPLEEVARFLGGFERPGDPARSGVETFEEGLNVVAAGPETEEGIARPVTIVDAGMTRRLDLRVEMGDEAMLPDETSEPALSGPHTPRGAWPGIHRTLLREIRRHRSTLIFVNGRRLAERVAAAVNTLAGEEIAQAHHGSIARERRLQIETALKEGKLPALVATSTLELGIDMGAIDLVILVEPPPGVSSALQRVGRAGHRMDMASTGVLVPKHSGDLAACAALIQGMRDAAVETLRYPRNCLDVLAQQIVAMVSMDDWDVDRLESVIRRAAPYQRLPRALFEETLDMLSGRYPSDEFAELRPRITWDRQSNTLRERHGARRVAVANAGSIPDRGLYGVYLEGEDTRTGRVGELDEIMVFESKEGDVITLGASSWRITRIEQDRVLVEPAPGEPGRIPFWHGENVGRTPEFGRRVGELIRRLRELPAEQAHTLLTRDYALSKAAAEELLDYLERQAQATGVVPDDRTILVERNRDELGDWRLCVLTPYGTRVHAPWSLAVASRLRDRMGTEPDVVWSDSGFVVRVREVEQPPPVEWLLPSSEEVQDLVVRQLGSGHGARPISHGAPPTSLFSSRFREAAGRALLLPRKTAGRRTALWRQRKRAADLLHVTARFGSFPIVLETYRECLQDVFDLPALVDLLRRVESGEARVASADTQIPSPFAASMLFSYLANFLYEGDGPLAERRAQALTVDPAQLRQLLGEVAFRDLLDPDVVAEMETRLRMLDAERAARYPDELHDMLLYLGDLTPAEVKARCAESGLLETLEREGRALRVRIAGETRCIAVEDAARYRDALGVTLPEGIAESLLLPARSPLDDLVGRYARTHGPFRAEDAAARLGIGRATVADVLARLAETGRVLRGEFRPGGSGLEWCDADVLRTLRLRSLARLRREVEPVAPAALARFLLEWHGIHSSYFVEASGAPTSREEQPVHQAPRNSGSCRQLLEIVSQLEGAPLPASVLEHEILAKRMPDYDPRDLDLAIASGQVVWVGAGALGPRDGRVRLVLAENSAATLSALTEAREEARQDLSGRILAFLAERGASFFPHILQGVGRPFPPEALEALWDLVWAGLVTNDTFQVVREWTNPHRDRKARELPRRMARLHAPRARLSVGRPQGLLSNVPPEALGRWSLVGPPGSSMTPTEHLAGRAELLLARHGVLTREAVAAEELPGGFSAIYPVLRAAEEAGRIRRGYFVQGLGALQFALPEAVERLRRHRDASPSQRAIVLAATDPANPYGTILPWPERPDALRAARSAGADVVLLEGRLAAWLSVREDALLTYSHGLASDEAERLRIAVAAALAAEVQRGAKPGLLIHSVDGRPVQSSDLAAALERAGFVRTHRGYLMRR